MIASALFLVSPYVLGFYNYVFLENFLTAFSLVGFYFFIGGLEENSKKKLFIAGLFFGLAVLIKQMAVLLFPTAIFILLLKSMGFPVLRNTGKFLRRVSIIASGGLLIGLVILAYFIFHGTLVNFYNAMDTSVQHAQEWVNPSDEMVLKSYIMPSLKANELITLIFGISGIIVSLVFFFARWNNHFGIKIFTLWIIIYVTEVYNVSYSYGFYYIPILPPLVILSAYTVDSILSLKWRYKKVIIALFLGLLAIDIYHLSIQYQVFTPNPMGSITLLTPPLDEQISIGTYLYGNTTSNDKIFSIDPVYALVAGRGIVNHFTVSGTELPTIKEYTAALSDENVKYAVVDDRARFHLRNKWSGEKIGDLNLSLDFKLEDPENMAEDGVVIEIQNRGNSSLWWIHANDWKANKTSLAYYDIHVKTQEWTNITVDLTSGFKTYFGYIPDEYKIILWVDADNGSSIKLQVDKIVIWDKRIVYLNESFDTNSSLKKFMAGTRNGREGWSNTGIKDGHLNIESFNETYGISTIVAPGVLGYIFQNFEKEKEFIITASKTNPKKTTVSLYRKR